MLVEASSNKTLGRAQQWRESLTDVSGILGLI